jgi:hypothetical protein
MHNNLEVAESHVVLTHSEKRIMGWWKVNPKTGKPLKTPSKLSKPGHVLLNAVPGIDDDPKACLLGDPPFDALDMATDSIRGLAPAKSKVSKEEWEAFALKRKVPAALKPHGAELREIAAGMWEEIQESYEDDLDRKLRKSEKALLVKLFIERLTAKKK